jgi:hypothetical protein
MFQINAERQDRRWNAFQTNGDMAIEAKYTCDKKMEMMKPLQTFSGDAELKSLQRNAQTGVRRSGLSHGTPPPTPGTGGECFVRLGDPHAPRG